MPVYPHTFHFPMSRHSRGENPLLCFLNVPRNAFLFLQGGDFRRRDELVGKAYMMGSFQIPAQDLTMRRLRGYEIKTDVMKKIKFPQIE
ncbi:hypothetical protein V6Z12_D05G327800 [Gossypium hirsutum]